MDTSKTAAGMNKKTAKAARKAAAAAAAATAAASTGSGPAAAAAAAASTATRVQQQAEDPFPPSLSGSSAPFPISAAKPLLSTTATGALTASAAVQLAQRLAAVSLQDASLNPAAAAESRHDGGDADFDRFDVDLDAEGPSFSTKVWTPGKTESHNLFATSASPQGLFADSRFTRICM
ncbi:hypothetical protein DFJ73DRAFT_1268 [Zopfochytrium polystomum]|nr:hypothetical protein DFJ73DRAFT_1268 [Zopfochytrium polystomum]